MHKNFQSFFRTSWNNIIFYMEILGLGVGLINLKIIFAE